MTNPYKDTRTNKRTSIRYFEQLNRENKSLQIGKCIKKNRNSYICKAFHTRLAQAWMIFG